MKQIKLRNVKIGEFFRLTNSETAPVWIRNVYDRRIKKFEAYKYDNVNHWSLLSGSRLVYVESEF